MLLIYATKTIYALKQIVRRYTSKGKTIIKSKMCGALPGKATAARCRGPTPSSAGSRAVRHNQLPAAQDPFPSLLRVEESERQVSRQKISRERSRQTNAGLSKTLSSGLPQLVVLWLARLLPEV